MLSWRLQALLLGFFFLGGIVTIRLFYWQIITASQLQAIAESQYFHKEEILPERGRILASDGFPLATNKLVYSLFASSPQINLDANEIANRLSLIISSDKEQEEEAKSELLNKLTGNPKLVWIPLVKSINRDTKNRIEELNVSGLEFEEDKVRYYPEASMSAHLLGFVGQDENGKPKGYFGVEGFYERTLAGKPGFLNQEQDASGKPILIGKITLENKVEGRDLQLFLNRKIQFIVEEKLKAAIEQYQAKGGSVIVMNPFTGAILAMASIPNYNGEDYAQSDRNLFSNPVISQSFEPGSIFKPIVMAAAINEGVITPNDTCLQCNGPRQVGEYVIRTWDEQYHPNSTMTEILIHSDNVGMVFVSEKLGNKKLLSYLDKFGINKLTNIDLEGELAVPLREEKDWTDIDYATASFGQGVAVTSIQMIRAISVIANGGELVEPHVVAKIIDKDKKIEVKAKKEGQIINKETAQTVKEMMVEAAEKGGKWEKIPGVKVAGKTGTAQIPIAGHYDKTKTIVSFIGFAPADNPQFVMLVTLREPNLIWGGMTAAPLWFQIAKQILIY